VDLALRWADLEVEVPEEFIPTKPSMSLCASGKTVSAKLGVVTSSTVSSAT
jgi:hypothetical protein